MRIIGDLREFPPARSAVAVGKFDGVHRGHRKLLTTLTGEAQKRGLISTVFTFDPPPAVLFGNADEKMLLPRDQQREIFARMGVDVLVEFPFTRENAAISPEAFVRDILAGNLHAALIVSGADVTFGAEGRGDLELLRRLAGDLELDICVIDKVLADGAPVSSTRIRQALREGRIEEARAWMAADEGIAGSAGMKV